MKPSETQIRIAQQNRILNAWLALHTELKNADGIDYNQLNVDIVLANIGNVSRVIVALEELDANERRAELEADFAEAARVAGLKAEGIKLDNLI